MSMKFAAAFGLIFVVIGLLGFFTMASDFVVVSFVQALIKVS